MDSRRIKITVILIGIVFLSMILRLRGINNPLLDDQAWRQTDTAGMALFMEGKLNNFPDVLFPKLSYDGSTPQKVELECPIFPYILALTWNYTGHLDILGRVWSIIFSLITILGMYFLGKELFSPKVGLISAAVYSSLPLAVYYGRVIMPEPLAQAFTVWAINTLLFWRRNNKISNLLLAGIIMAGAILGKLPQIMVFPVAVILGFIDFSSGWRIDYKKLLVYGVIACIPPLIYYSWVHFGSNGAGQFVSGIFSIQVLDGLNFWQALKKNVQTEITFTIIVLALLGLIMYSIVRVKARKIASTPEFFALILWTVISFFYVFFICIRIPLDYYLVPILPLLSLFVGYFISNLGRVLSPLGTIILVLWLVKTGYSNLTAKYTWDTNYLAQAEWIQEHTPEHSILILSDSPPMTFYYSRKVGYRLNVLTDKQAFEFLNSKGDFLIKLPNTQRSNNFWNQVEQRYDQIGPGVYEL